MRNTDNKPNDHLAGEWLPAAAVRREFGVSRTTEWRWSRDGILPEPARIAGRRYYARSAIDDLKRRAAQPGGVNAQPSV